MGARGLPVALNRGVPFVSAVFDVIEGRGTVAHAAVVLEQAEAACGVAFWHDAASSSSVLGCGAFAPRDTARPPSLAEALAAMREDAAFEQAFRASSGEPDDAARARAVDALLSATHLVLQGADFTNDHFVRHADGTVEAWTQRAWGALLARWANAAGWGPHTSRRGDRYSWTYVEFYVGLSEKVVEHYGPWSEVVREVLAHKTRAAGRCRV